MNEFLDVLLDSFLDTVKLIPFLFFVYFLIELLEYKNVFRFEKSKLLTGGASPAVGTCFGIVPQCGFSVISAELYSERKMSISALIAVFLATSDEAFPILISNYKSIPVLIALLLVKLIIALVVGYLIYFIYEKLMKKASTPKANKNDTANKDAQKDATITKSEGIEIHSSQSAYSHSEDLHTHADNHFDEHEHNDTGETEDNHVHSRHLHACCHHDIEDQQKFNWKHPLIHCFKIALYIFIVNFILSGLIALIGEENISAFLTTSSAFQPLFALIIGFIPNCASSVILTELFMEGMISFGSIVTGLCANAGIGLFVLFKENKNIKENLFIVAVLIVTSLVFGYALHFIPLDFLNIWL